VNKWRWDSQNKVWLVKIIWLGRTPKTQHWNISSKARYCRCIHIQNSLYIVYCILYIVYCILYIVYMVYTIDM
jgi:hypothetical protein